MACVEVSHPPNPASTRERTSSIHPSSSIARTRARIRSISGSRDILRPGGAHRDRGVALPGVGEGGERAPGESRHLQGADGPAAFPGSIRAAAAGSIDARRAYSRSGPSAAAWRSSSRASVAIGPRELQPIDDRAEVEARPADQERRTPARAASAAARASGLEASHRERLRRLGDVEQVVADRAPVRRPSAWRCRRPSPGTRASSPPTRSPPPAPPPRERGLGLARRRWARPGPGAARVGHAGELRPRLRRRAPDSPARWWGAASVTVASDERSGLARRLGACTSLLVRVLPREASSRPRPSTRISTVRADHATGCARARSPPAARPAGRTAPGPTALGTWSSTVAAGVPGRGEYWNVNAASNRAASTTSSVSSKSSSVSPGKPDDDVGGHRDAGHGHADALQPLEVPRRDRYERRIACSTRSEPDCIGKWMCSQTGGLSAMASITSSVKSWGCGLVNRMRRIPRPRRPPAAARRTSAARRARNGQVPPVRVHVLPEQRHLDHARRGQAPAPRPGRRRWRASAAAPGPAARCRTCRRCRSPRSPRPTRGCRRLPPRRAARSGRPRSTRGRPSAGRRARRARCSSSRPGRACVPTTTSTHGAVAGSRPGPSARGSRRPRSAGRVPVLQRLQVPEGAVQAVVGVLAHRAGVEHHDLGVVRASVGGVIPSASSSPAIRSESCSFIWHPKVRIRYAPLHVGPARRSPGLTWRTRPPASPAPP